MLTWFVSIRNLIGRSWRERGLPLSPMMARHDPPDTKDDDQRLVKMFNWLSIGVIDLRPNSASEGSWWWMRTHLIYWMPALLVRRFAPLRLATAYGSRRELSHARKNTMPFRLRDVPTTAPIWYEADEAPEFGRYRGRCDALDVRDHSRGDQRTR